MIFIDVAFDGGVQRINHPVLPSRRVIYLGNRLYVDTDIAVIQMIGAMQTVHSAARHRAVRVKLNHIVSQTSVPHRCLAGVGGPVNKACQIPPVVGNLRDVVVAIDAEETQ